MPRNILTVQGDVVVVLTNWASSCQGDGQAGLYSFAAEADGSLEPGGVMSRFNHVGNGAAVSNG